MPARALGPQILPIHRYMLLSVVREPTFLILAAVAADPLHGYGIIQSVEELSDGRVRLRAGTLYAALDRLVREGSLRRRPRGGRRRAGCAATTGSPTAGSTCCAEASRISRATSRPRAGSSCDAPSWGSHDARAALPPARARVPGGLAPRSTRTSWSARCSTPPSPDARRSRPREASTSCAARRCCATATRARPTRRRPAPLAVARRSSSPLARPARAARDPPRVPADLARGRGDPGHRRLLHRLELDRRRLGGAGCSPRSAARSASSRTCSRRCSASRASCRSAPRSSR